MGLPISALTKTADLLDSYVFPVVTDRETMRVTYGFLKSKLKTAFDIDGIVRKLNECFTSVSNGKALVASAITDKGVETASDATFVIMTENIRAITSGGTHIDGSYAVVIPIYYGSVNGVSGAYEILD